LIALFAMRNYDVSEEKANEIRAELERRKKKPVKLTSSYYQADKLLSFSTLGLAIDSKSDIDFTTKSETEIKQLFNQSLNSGLHGLCFSPYQEGQQIGDILSENQIRHRMKIVAPHTKWVRSFSCTDGNDWIPKVAKESGLKTMVGAWISDDKERNEIEINLLIDLAKAGYVDIVAVGNEVLLRNELSEAEILSYIQRVKRALPNIPVGYVDAYYQFLERPNLVEACDVVLANCYPFWEGCNIDQASMYLKQMHALTQRVAKGKPVLITETGWPSQGSNSNSAQPSAVNTMKYFINVHNWQQEKDIPLFYFSSFDESWKARQEGDVGARWGIWDKDEQLKFG